MASKKTLAIVLGAGPGTGQAIGAAFSKVHDAVALLARRKETLNEVRDAIVSQGGNAEGFSCDATDLGSVESAFDAIKSKWPDHVVKCAIFNANNPFIMKPFLELTAKDLAPGLDLNVYGAFSFAQKVLPLLLEAGGGTLLFSGATAAIKGSAQFAAFAPAKFALRGLSQNLAREFGPQGVHVAHIILDGLIDTPAIRQRRGEGEPGKRMTPESIADAYVYLASQDRSAWTQELDLRPSSENW
ncbi:hypothetical protein OIV83_001796 [Microbotryomycetes sp. JL201]|nr:hypothetical protein OIV83_001796 [Microbotryomycetes sp. JL201]